MVAAHDELFCKLAIRAGHLDRETAIELLGRFREEARRGRPIAEFAVAEEYLDQETADSIEEIISQRASGHVSEARRPARKVKAAGGASKVHRKHHTPAQARTVKNNPAQVALIGSAMVVLVVVVIVLVVQLYESDAQTPAQLTEQGRKDRLAHKKEKSKSDDKVAKLKDPDIEKAARVYTQEELDRFESRLKTATINARQERGDGRPYRALLMIKKTKKDLGGEQLPEAILEKFTKEEGEIQQAIEAAYRDLMVNLEKAKSDDNSADVENLLADIEEKCGPEFLATAKKQIGM